MKTMIHHESDALPIEGMYHVLTELFPEKAITNPEPNLFIVDCVTHTHQVTFTDVMEGFTIMEIAEAKEVDLATEAKGLILDLIELLKASL